MASDGTVNISTNIGNPIARRVAANTSPRGRTVTVRYSLTYTAIPTGYFSDDQVPITYTGLTTTCFQEGAVAIQPVFDAGSARVNNRRVANGGLEVIEGAIRTFRLTPPTVSNTTGGIVVGPRGLQTLRPGELDEDYTWTYTNTAGTATYTITVEASI